VKIHLALLGRFESPRVQNAAVSLQALCSDHAVGLRLSRIKRAGNVDVQEVVVPMISLDEAGRSIASTGKDRDLGVWIDVEGSALDVLRSGESLLKQRVSIAYVEVNDVSAYEGIALRLPHMASWGGNVVRLGDGAGRDHRRAACGA
jgi:Methyltransferase FkbM domain